MIEKTGPHLQIFLIQFENTCYNFGFCTVTCYSLVTNPANISSHGTIENLGETDGLANQNRSTKNQGTKIVSMVLSHRQSLLLTDVRKQMFLFATFARD